MSSILFSFSIINLATFESGSRDKGILLLLINRSTRVTMSQTLATLLANSPVQTLSTLLGPTCCERLHTMLCVVACCCDLLEQQLPTMLRLVGQQCCERLPELYTSFPKLLVRSQSKEIHTHFNRMSFSLPLILKENQLKVVTNQSKGY